MSTFDLRRLLEISALLNSSLDPADVRRHAMEAARLLTEAEAGSLLLRLESSGELYLEVALGEKAETVGGLTLPAGEGIAGAVAGTGTAVIVNDVRRDPRFCADVDARSGFVTRNMVCAPIMAKDQVLGVLQAINKLNGRDFVEVDLQALVALGHQVGIAIQNARLYDEINHLFEGFVSASVQAIESRDPATSGHSHRVAFLTCALAAAVDRCDRGSHAAHRFDAQQMKEIRFAAILHDFGKVGVRERVLVKARKLYPSDLALVKSRFDLIKRTAEADVLGRKVEVLRASGGPAAEGELARLDHELGTRLNELDAMFAFVLGCNEPDAPIARRVQRLEEIGARRYESLEGHAPYLSAQEVAALAIPAGTLTAEERKEIEQHVTHTHAYLCKIPWSRSLRSVPEIAYAHHEKLDGTGYPRGLSGDQIPIQSRMMAIADIYDALTASDRPYRTALPRARALDVLATMARRGKLDAELVTLFLDERIFARVEPPAGSPRRPMS